MSVTSDKEQSCQSGDIRNAGLIPGLRENPLEEGMATYSSIFAWSIPMDRRASGGYSSWGHKKSDTAEQLSTAQHNQFELNDMQCFIEIDKVENPEYRESM